MDAPRSLTRSAIVRAPQRPPRGRNAVAFGLAPTTTGPLLTAAWWPLFGTHPKPGIQLLATFAAVMGELGCLGALRADARAFGPLWAALGAATALTTIGVVSLGFLIAPAAPLLIGAISVAPDPAHGGARRGRHTALAFAAGYGAAFLSLML